jgi:streptomycin 6-kinase
VSPRVLSEHARRWRVTIDELVETETSFIGYGWRRELPVVLKVGKRPDDEWRSGEVLRAFEGRGTARVYEYLPGALLMERLSPATALVELSLTGRDDEATDILADVIGRMFPGEIGIACPTVQDWGKSFELHSSRTTTAVTRSLVLEAQQVFDELCRSQTNTGLLHGDLHHYNVLIDRDRGWLAIDPKGVIGEIEYEIGAALRNPVERTDRFADAAIVEKRLSRFASKLEIDSERALRWAFAQAVLAAIWELEDGAEVTPEHPFIRLAEAIRPMLVI